MRERRKKKPKKETVAKKREARRRDGRNFLPSARARESGRERDISSLSPPADVVATRIRLISAADVDTTRQQLDRSRTEKEGWDRWGELKRLG